MQNTSVAMLQHLFKTPLISMQLVLFVYYGWRNLLFPSFYLNFVNDLCRNAVTDNGKIREEICLD